MVVDFKFLYMPDFKCNKGHLLAICCTQCNEYPWAYYFIKNFLTMHSILMEVLWYLLKLQNPPVISLIYVISRHNQEVIAVRDTITTTQLYGDASFWLFFYGMQNLYTNTSEKVPIWNFDVECAQSHITFWINQTGCQCAAYSFPTFLKELKLVVIYQPWEQQ